MLVSIYQELVKYINLLFYFTFAVLCASVEHLHILFKKYTEKVSKKSLTTLRNKLRVLERRERGVGDPGGGC